MLLNIFTLILETICGMLAGVLLLRFWMQAVRVRPPMQVAQFTFQLSDWLVRPLRRLLPGFGGYDWASLVAAYLVALSYTAIKLWLYGVFAIDFVLLQSLIRLVHWILYGFIGLLILEVVFSWINPHAPLAPLVRALNDPLLRPLRRIVPLIGNIDFSVMVASLLLYIALMVTASIVPLA